MERGYAAAPHDDFAISGLAQMLVPAGQAARAVALMKPRLEKNRDARAYGGRSMLTLYGWALSELGDSTNAALAFNEVLGRMKTGFEQGWRLYGAWTIVDPMFRTIRDDPAVIALVERMRADVGQKRERLGLAAQP